MWHSTENKKELLEIARSNGNRPSKKTKLGSALSHYTNRSSGAYDPVFDAEIRKSRPDWFINITDVNKKELLKIAKNGGDRPSYKTKLGSALSRYTNRSKRSSYDPVFDAEIRKLRPDWFGINKKELLEIARNGGNRPSQKTKFGSALCCYTNRSKKTYDPEFDAEIRKLRPDWFVTKNNVDINKKELLEIARSNGDRPSYKTKLGSALSRYTNRSCNTYDPEFDAEIRKLRPGWFVTRNNADINKKELLEIAKNGGDKPHLKTKLGSALYCYTNPSKNSYDPEFDAEIRKPRPDWFQSKSERIAEIIRSFGDNIEWMPPVVWWYILIQAGVEPKANHVRLLKIHQGGRLSLDKLVDAVVNDEDVPEVDENLPLPKKHTVAKTRTLIEKLLGNPIFASMDEEAVAAILNELKEMVWEQIFKEEENK